MSLEKINVLEFNQYIKSDKLPYIIHADMEPLIIKIDWCANNPENYLRKKLGQCIPFGYSKPTIWTFAKVLRIFKRKHKKHNWFWKQKTVTVNRKRIKFYQDARNCCICGRRVLKKLSKSINYRKVRNYWHYTEKYRGAAHSIRNSKIDMPNESPCSFS